MDPELLPLQFPEFLVLPFEVTGVALGFWNLRNGGLQNRNRFRVVGVVNSGLSEKANVSNAFVL